MEGNMFKKALVIGIIVLFLGLSIQPSLGTEIPVTREIEFNEDIEECKPCKLIELLREYRDLKFKNFKFSNIINKLNSINNERLICQILVRVLQFNIITGLTFTLIMAYLEEVAPSIHDLLYDFWISTLDSMSKRFRSYCVLFEDVYKCGDFPACG